jgi:hypothetical protein
MALRITIPGMRMRNRLPERLRRLRGPSYVTSHRRLASSRVPVLLAATLCFAVVLSGTPRSAPVGTDASAGSQSWLQPQAAHAATSRGVSDKVQLGNHASERAHRLTAQGESERVQGTVNAGQLTEPYTARSVASGGRFQVRLDVARTRPLTLQFKEVRPDDAWGAAFGFRVFVDGTLLYVRDPATTDPGGGPYSSFFLDTADPSIIGDGKAVVTVEGLTAEPAYISEIWAYADLPGMVRDQGMRVPDRMVFVLGQDHRGEAFFRQRLDYVTSAIHERPEVGRGMAVLDYFPVRTPAQMSANYQLWLQLSREYGLPFGIESTSDWEGTPSRIPDGKGGTFGDIEYHQILWSPQDRTGPDKDVFRGQRLDELLGEDYDPRYGLSVPNIWGSTPWLTWRHPDLNAYFEKKANESLELIRPLYWDLQRSGEADRLLSFSTTLESTYWSKRDGKGVADQAYTEYNDGVERRDLYADYNPYTVAAARAEGVELDPTDGLSEAEKRWMYRNQSYPQQLFADIFYAGLPRPRIEVGPGVRFPTDSLRHNVHSEVYSRMQEPYWDDVHPSTAQGVVRHGRPGAEYIELDDYTKGGFYHLQKLREFGRIANPNLENSVSGYGPDKTLLLRQTYVNGSRYTAIYNWQGEGSPDAAAGWVNAFVDDFHPWDVVRDDRPDGAVEGERAVTTTFTAGDLRLLNQVDVRIERTGKPAPLRLTVSDDTGRVVTMRHLSAEEVAQQVTSSGWVSFLVPVVALTRGQSYTVTVEQEQGEPAYRYPTASGEIGLRVGLDMPAERDRSLVIQWRRDAADAIAHVTDDLGSADGLAKGVLAKAQAALAKDRYVEAYRLAIKADALRFPVLYQVAPGKKGHLAPFPVTVQSPTSLDIDVTEFADGRSMELSVKGTAPDTVELTVSGFGKEPVVLVDGVRVPTEHAGTGTKISLALPDTEGHVVRINR